ncbi:hypothetical protein ACSYGO_16985 [Streptomyces krungchingensis]
MAWQRTQMAGGLSTGWDLPRRAREVESERRIDFETLFDLAKLSFGIIAGTATLVPLIVAYRRQRVDEDGSPTITDHGIPTGADHGTPTEAAHGFPPGTDRTSGEGRGGGEEGGGEAAAGGRGAGGDGAGTTVTWQSPL